MSLDDQEQDSTDEVQSAATDKLAKKVELTNIAEKLDEDLLVKIGQDCRRGFLIDEDSRKEWLDNTQEWLDLAKQLRDRKTFPWDGAPNVKYPLISTAAMQFAARAYPSLVPGDGNVVASLGRVS